MGQSSIIDARINLVKCEYSMLYVFYEMGWRGIAPLYSTPPLNRRKNINTFSIQSLRRTPRCFALQNWGFGSQQPSYENSQTKRSD